MTVVTLLADLQKRDVVLAADGEALDVDAPPGVLTPDLRSALVQHKAELLALLRAPSGTPGEPSGTLGPGVPGFPETVARLLGLPLPAFAEAGVCLEVRVRWHPETLWFVPSADAAGDLEADGVSRGRIWTAAELMDLLSIPGVTKDRARTVALAKLAVAGEAAEVRPHVRTCPACHGRCWWRSVHGPTRCKRCHPPAGPEVVVEWIGEAEL